MRKTNRRQRMPLTAALRTAVWMAAAIGCSAGPLYAGYSPRGGDDIPVAPQTIEASGTVYAFEDNGEFATPPDAVVRVAAPLSVNGDGLAWKVTVTDPPGEPGQQFRVAGWALNGLNVSGVTHVSFYVRGETGFMPFEVGLQDTSFNSYRIHDAGSTVHPNLGDYVQAGENTVTDEYQYVRIPLSAFSSNGVHLESLDAFQIISVAPDAQDITIFMDAMSFEDIPQELPPAISRSISFEDTFTFVPGGFADPNTEAFRITAPISRNGDQLSWRIVLTDQTNGAQKHSLLGFGLNGVDASLKDDLVFYARGQAGGESLRVGLKDTGGISYHRSIGTAVTQSYQEIRISLLDFVDNGVNIGSLDSFELVSDAPDGEDITIYLDTMGFE